MSSMQEYAHSKYFKISSLSEYVAQVELHRPDKLNAFIEEMWQEMGRIFASLSHDPNVRAVVLTGAGDRAFTTGLDVKAASQSSVLSGFKSDGARTATTMRRGVEEMQRCISSIEKCEKPVICVLHGISWGLAIDIACCADIRICSKDTEFSVKEVDIGLAADLGTLSRLSKVVGNSSWAKEICLSARQFSAEEALSFGFVSHIHESKAKALEEVQNLAKLIASKSPVAVQGTKELMNHARDSTVADSLRYTAIWNSTMLQSSDVTAAISSAMRKEKPTFEKL